MPQDLCRGDIIRVRDERWTVRRHHQRGVIAIVDVCGRDRTNRGVRARFLLPFEPVERLPAQTAIQVVGRRRWQHQAAQVLASAMPEYDSLRILATARIEVLPFQLEPALAVVRGAASRLLIADEVGLGKTVQAGLIVAETLERHGDARVLVVCPAALRDQWSEELTVRFGLEPRRFDSMTVARLGSQVPPGVNPWAAQRLIVTSIDYMKRPETIRALEGLIWDVVVIDEAHGLAGRSERFAAAVVLGGRARTLVLLTATPHSGDDEAFHRLCSIGDIGQQFPLAVFRRGRRDAGLPSSRRTLWLDVASTSAERAMHHALADYVRLVAGQRLESTGAARLAMIVLLRRGCSSASALARSITRRLLLLEGSLDTPFQPVLPFDGSAADDDEPVNELGARGLAEPEDERRLLHAILALAQQAAGQENKIRAIRRLLLRTREPAIVFTEYRDTLEMLAAALPEFPCVVLHGALSAGERRDVLQRFSSGTARVLLATDAAGEGLNLHHRCRLVINLELPWSPLRLEQRVGRVDRIGQSKRVHQVLLVARGTAEHTVVAACLRRRLATADQALAGLRPDVADEREIADRILGGTAAPATAEGTTVPRDGIVVTTLRDRAIEEAAWAIAARGLAPVTGSGTVPVRPFAAAVPRGSRGCCAFRIALHGADEELLWETVAGIWYTLPRPRFTTARELTRHFENAYGELFAAVPRDQTGAIARVNAAIKSSSSCALARERAIVDELDRRRARLAAALVQRALFDRRMERETAAQGEVLNEAIAQCRDRLARLTHRCGPATVAVDPAFAVILR
jgi:superfamily II DNA or RNA helicase